MQYKLLLSCTAKHTRSFPNSSLTFKLSHGFFLLCFDRDIGRSPSVRSPWNNQRMLEPTYIIQPPWTSKTIITHLVVALGSCRFQEVFTKDLRFTVYKLKPTPGDVDDLSVYLISSMRPHLRLLLFCHLSQLYTTTARLPDA